MEHIILGTDEQQNIRLLRQVKPGHDLFITRDQIPCNFKPREMASYHLLHAGGAMLHNNAFQLLKHISLNWHYLDPPVSKTANTWKTGSDYIWINYEALAQVGGFDFNFSCVDAILSEVAYRILRQGGRVKYLPNVLPPVSRTIRISLLDELVFIKKYFGKRYTYLSLPGVINRHGTFRALRDWLKLIRKKVIFEPQQVKILSYQENSTGIIARPYTAIIPTILRYKYLEKAINSLLKNKIAPAEIIVVDQTPEDQRIPHFYSAFDPAIVKVYYLAQPGQSTARNLAIAKSTHELLLLFEDDGEAWDDMLEEHLKLLAVEEVDVSTGVALGPGKTTEHIPAGIRGYHITDVLATGNAMVRKSVLQKVKGLDKAFDHGSGADDDLGKRLYLNGAEIVFNPNAIMTHYKAPMGGMRVHGAWWRNKTNLWAEYPPATQLYAIRKYYDKSCWANLVFIQFLKAAKRNTFLQQIWLFVMLPYKYRLARKKALQLLANP